ncbi:MAG: AAA family ATPase [Proteobacteria bacterium]|nr:AAA family ATPase [Desulfobacula sp.]MBU3952065.1 AAA family ATPase [Pseudomonadota bacterium]MBU4132727.1 AAA family ATPase [Pseudomonadota bacterium]
MKNVFIETSRVMAFREAAGVVTDTAKGQPGFMVVWGYAGRGKTQCSKEYAVRTPGTIYIRVFEGWTPRAMLAQICHKINGMQPSYAGKAKQIIMEELDRNPKVILMDEADRLSNGNIEHLRDIHDETGTPIVMIGEPSLYGRLTARRRIWERVTRVVEFGPVRTEDVAIFGMKACDLKIMPEASAELVRRCQGSFRLLYHLMVDLERQSRANKVKTITLEMIEALPDRRIAPTPEKEPR